MRVDLMSLVVGQIAGAALCLFVLYLLDARRRRKGQASREEQRRIAHMKWLATLEEMSARNRQMTDTFERLRRAALERAAEERAKVARAKETN